MEREKREGGIPILDGIKRVPGGLMLVPMFLMALIHTLDPELFLMGGPAEAVFSAQGTMYLVGLMLFCSGTQCGIRQVPDMLRVGGLLCVLKLAVMALACWAVQAVFGLEGFLGVSLLALVPVIGSVNPGLYMALVSSRAERGQGGGTELSVFSLLNLLAVPAIPAMILNMAAGAKLEAVTILSILIPFFLGMALGNLDGKIRAMFRDGCTMLLPFMGICLGSNINLITAAKAGAGGFLAAALFYLAAWLPLYAAERALLKRDGSVSTAMSAVAGLSAAVPALAAQMNPAFEPYVETAVGQIAFAVIITSIVTPVIMRRIEGRGEGV